MPINVFDENLLTLYSTLVYHHYRYYIRFYSADLLFQKIFPVRPDPKYEPLGLVEQILSRPNALPVTNQRCQSVKEVQL